MVNCEKDIARGGTLHLHTLTPQFARGYDGPALVRMLFEVLTNQNAIVGR
jgi:hypothetical protein